MERNTPAARTGTGISSLSFACALLASLAGCSVPVGYSFVKNANQVANSEVTIIEVNQKKIYDATAAALVGTLAGAQASGTKIKFVDGSGKIQEVLQPATDRYELRAGQKANLVAVRGQVWVQPLDYPLPPEFGLSTSYRPSSAGLSDQTTNKAASAAAGEDLASSIPREPFTLKLGADWQPLDLTPAMKAFGWLEYQSGRSGDAGMLYLSRRASDVADLKAYADTRNGGVAGGLIKPQRHACEAIKVNGHNGVKCVVEGVTMGMNIVYQRGVIANGQDVREVLLWSSRGQLDGATEDFNEALRLAGQ